MSNPTFQLKSAQFTTGDSHRQEILFLGPRARADRTHITLIVGANGTSKSRMLASIVDRFCELNDEASDGKTSKRYGSSGNHGLFCEKIDARSQLSGGINEASRSVLLPSKILVLSNLVMDRFRFAQSESNESEFYRYLGVRQATNLMTTGSMQRSVSEAIMSLYQDQEKRKLFQKWIELVFGGEAREISLVFDISRSTVENYAFKLDAEAAIIERIMRFTRKAASRDENLNQGDKEAVTALVKLFKFLLARAEELKASLGKRSGVNNMILRLDAHGDDCLNELAGLHAAFGAAMKARLFSWPSVAIEGNAWAGWTDFGQLSSGEQNILSTGAKLIAYAEPGCLVAIDEPEVSLNTSWQQHYTDLVAYSLSQARGSHVLIATHSPHLISSLPLGEASVVLIERNGSNLKSTTLDAEFEGWGAESILYQVLDVPSASNFKFQRELASVLLHIQNHGKDKKLIDNFLVRANRLNIDETGALATLVNSIRQYRDILK